MDHIVSITVFLILVSFAWCGLSVAPYLPTRKKDIERIVSLSKLKPGDRFLEIGFGDGRVSISLAKAYPEVEVVGVELSPILYIIGKTKELFSGAKNLTFKLKNAYHIDLSEYDVIYIYGMPDNLAGRLKDKFLKELKPGARIISYSFAIKDWPGKVEQDKPQSYMLSFYVHTKK